ncbi:hypothetical protein ATJ97_3465 [Georgenia soli]|uniref:Uncharacterized protein n=1 Tax=Georgenia soli TaxID=638953 RepID=A0A2A9EQ67_9MICO|nr:hypothetical protein [Georgenia soli]PFG40923.1 hypothetical protein ATJ97_3465 [Georgenia soli]
MTDLPTADRTSSRAGTTTEQAPPAPLTLVPVPGLQGIGGDAVGFCGPDGCHPVDPGPQPAGAGERSAGIGEQSPDPAEPPAAPAPTDPLR